MLRQQKPFLLFLLFLFGGSCSINTEPDWEFLRIERWLDSQGVFDCEQRMGFYRLLDQCRQSDRRAYREFIDHIYNQDIEYANNNFVNESSSNLSNLSEQEKDQYIRKKIAQNEEQRKKQLKQERARAGQAFFDQQRIRPRPDDTPSPRACMDIINNDPYALKVYNEIKDLHNCVAHINHPDLPIRIETRIRIFEATLPKPYSNKLNKTINNYAKKYLDAQGDLKIDLVDVPEKVFKGLLKNASKNFQKFYNDMPTMHKDKGYHSSRQRSDQSRCLMDMIEHQHEWDDLIFAEKYRSCSKTLLARKLYSYYMNKRFHTLEVKEKIERDPRWRNATSAQRSDPSFQSQLILRGYYFNELRQSARLERYASEESSDALYKVIDSHPDLYNRRSGYQDEMYTMLVANACVGIDNCPKDLAKALFHESGVLKEHMQDAYTRFSFSQHKLSDPRLHYALNNAMTMRKKNVSQMSNDACYEIQNCVKMALRAEDPEVAKLHENHALELQQKIKNHEQKFLEVPEATKEEMEAFTSVFMNGVHHPERYAAYLDALNEDFHEYAVVYSLDPEVKGFLQAQGINPRLYTDVTANGFQHELTEELIAILKETASTYASFMSRQTSVIHSFLNQGVLFCDQFFENVAFCAHLSQEYNLLKKYDWATTAADTSLFLLRWGEAVALGVGRATVGASKTVYGAIKSFKNTDPGQLLVGAAKGIVKLFELVDNSIKNRGQDLLSVIHPGVIPRSRNLLDQVKEAADRAKIKLEIASSPQRATMLIGTLGEQLLLTRLLSTTRSISEGLVVHAERDLDAFQLLNAERRLVMHVGPQDKLLASSFQKVVKKAPSGMLTESTANLAKETVNKVRDATKAIIASTIENNSKVLSLVDKWAETQKESIAAKKYIPIEAPREPLLIEAPQIVEQEVEVEVVATVSSERGFTEKNGKYLPAKKYSKPRPPAKKKVDTVIAPDKSKRKKPKTPKKPPAKKSELNRFLRRKFRNQIKTCNDLIRGGGKVCKKIKNKIKSLYDKFTKERNARRLERDRKSLESVLSNYHEKLAVIKKINEVEKCKVRYFLGKSEEIELNMMHMYATQAIVINGKAGIEGPHYYQGTVDEFLKEFNNKHISAEIIANRGEFYSIRISINGGEGFIKTVHVTQSSPEESFASMMEAFADTREEVLEGKSMVRYRTVGYTKGNVRIVFIFDRNKGCSPRLVSFYACEDWVGERINNKIYSPGPLSEE